jgi:hypothetical protein
MGRERVSAKIGRVDEMVKWTADLRTEQVLSRLGVDVLTGPEGQKLANIPASAVIQGNMASNTARIGKRKIDLDLAEDYWHCMQSGDAFPAIVVVQVDGRYQIAGGNHRFQAACNIGKQQTIAAYVIRELQSPAYTLLCQTLNSVEGSRVGREDRVKMALAYFHMHGVTQKEAARMYQVPANTLGSAIRSQKLAEHLAQAGVDIADVGARWRELLHANVKDAPVFTKLAQLAQKGTLEERDAASHELQVAKCEADRLAGIDSILQHRKSKTVAGVRLDRHRTKLLAAVKSIEAILEGRTLEVVQISTQEGIEIAARLESAANKLCRRDE